MSIPTQTPSVVATLATGGAKEDLRILLSSLAIFNTSPPKIYLYCDNEIVSLLPTFKYPGTILTSTAELNKYSGLNRQQMERVRGRRYPSLWFDFMAEKIHLMKWALKAEEEATAAAAGGVLFCDADICFFAPLPAIPLSADIALSHHEIRAVDEALYGRYNGGFFWMGSPKHADIWLTACDAGQRFFEQSALEDVAAATRATREDTLYEFPRSQNFGWWRLWQGETSHEELQKEWTMNRRKNPAASGILIRGEPLGSVHTHFSETKDAATVKYNVWVLAWLERLAPSHFPARRLLGQLKR